MADGKGINGAGLGVAAVGAVVAWSGMRNVPLLETFRSLAMGKLPAPRPKPGYQPVQVALSGLISDSLNLAADAATGGRIVAGMAAQKGRTYRFGAGHGGDPCAGAGDCSSTVSCALKRAGVLQGGSLTTDGLARWGRSVPFAQREPGDVLVWVGGPGGGHTGVAIDGTHMWHNPCTGCGGTQVGTYGSSRTGRPTIVRRAG